MVGLGDQYISVFFLQDFFVLQNCFYTADFYRNSLSDLFLPGLT